MDNRLTTIMSWSRGVQIVILVWGLSVSAASRAEVLPVSDQVRKALLSSPNTQAALAKKNSMRSQAEATRSGNAEFILKGALQQRYVKVTPGNRFYEYSMGLERALRSWGKAEVDDEIASAMQRYADIEYADTVHEASRDFLHLWFTSLQAIQTRTAAEQFDASARQLLDVAQKRLRVGEISRLDAELLTADASRAQASLEMARLQEKASAAQLTQRYPGIIPLDKIPEDTMPTLRYEQMEYRKLYLEKSHGLNLLKLLAEQLRWRAQRRQLDKTPDPTVGVFMSREKDGAEWLQGLSVSIPIAGEARRSLSEAAWFEAETANQQVLNLERQIVSEFDVLWLSMHSQQAAAKVLQEAVHTQYEAVQKAQKAYLKGEGSLMDVIVARKAHYDSQLSAGQMHLAALESYYRLRLDTHELWDWD